MHPAGIGAITRVAVTLPHNHGPSPTVKHALDTGLVITQSGPDYLLELGFTGDRRDALDLRPNLPVVFTPARNAG
jgi:hypothetical protein